MAGTKFTELHHRQRPRTSATVQLRGETEERRGGRERGGGGRAERAGQKLLPSRHRSLRKHQRGRGGGHREGGETRQEEQFPAAGGGDGVDIPAGRVRLSASAAGKQTAGDGGAEESEGAAAQPQPPQYRQTPADGRLPGTHKCQTSVINEKYFKYIFLYY